MLISRARAKVNLTLHILGRRADGYHELSSLVAFAGVGDLLGLTAAPGLSLQVEGRGAAGLGPIDRNLVIRASRELFARVPALRLGRFHLVKRLPAAAGIGGGSSDAAAALRLLARLNEMPSDHPAIAAAARATGADVPVCLYPWARMMSGIGERVGPALDMARLFCVLVNPGTAVATADVFRRLGLEPGNRRGAAEPPDDIAWDDVGEVIAWLSEGRNDLEAPARSLAPVIGDALDVLRGTQGCRLARMSGSGATVFGLYETRRSASAAARALRAARPGWWIRPTILR